MKKPLIFLAGCLLACLPGQAQELPDPHWVSDFENDEALYWNPIGEGVKLEVVDNPLADEVNASAKVLKMTLPKGESYPGAIITVDDLPVGDAEGHYRCGRVKIYRPQDGVSILKLQKGPDGAIREVSQTIRGGAWVDASFEFNFTAMGDEAAVGTYGEVFVIGKTEELVDEEVVMYIDDVRFTNEVPAVDDGLPPSTDELAVLDNFENGLVNFTGALQPMEGASLQVVDNPKPDAVNGSRKVLEVKRPEGKPAWVGFWGQLNATAAPKCDMDKYRYARFKVLQDVACDSASFKVEVQGDKFLEKKSPITKVNEWEEIIFDMEAAEGTYPVVAIMPDYAENQPAHSVYVDDIMFSKELNADIPGTGIDLLQTAGTVRTLATGTGVEVLFRTEVSASIGLNVYDTNGRLLATHTMQATPGDNRAVLDLQAEGILLLKLTMGTQSLVSKCYR